MLRSNTFWTAIGAIGGAIAALVAVYQIVLPQQAQSISIDPIMVDSNITVSSSDEFGLSVVSARLDYVSEYDSFEPYFFGLLTRRVPGGFAYGISVIFNKYDDEHYKNCSAEAPGLGRVYFFGLSVSSRHGIENPEHIDFDFGRGRYREYFTLLAPNEIEPIDLFSNARFSITCDGMVTVPVPIEVA